MTDHASRLAALRRALAAENLAGMIVPMADEFQSEYVPASARRIEYLTGFTGSSAALIVLQDEAAFFTDSRYTLQAASEVPDNYVRFDMQQQAPATWLGARLQHGARFGYDPWLHTQNGVDKLMQAAAQAGADLIALDRNPVDAVWTDRPPAPCAPIVPHGIEFAGRSASDKCAALAEMLQEQGCAAAVLGDPASIAWLLNIRGGDVPHTPLPLSFALVHAGGTVEWFVDPRKLTPDLAPHLGPDVHMSPLHEFGNALARLGTQHKPVRVDRDGTAAWILRQLEEAGAKLMLGDDPCALPRACKNEIERRGMRAAHRRDGVALARFFAWLAAQPPGSVGELQAEAQLEEMRAAQHLYRGTSFATIAGSGPHGAIVHYRATVASDRKLQAGELFLLDSGGQYLDGTTDVTRTVAIGKPTDEMRDRYTRVVQGNIALSAIRFPPGTRGNELDILARQYLWAAGVDYGHGTGHGVGSYLGVHEGPQSVSRSLRGQVALQPGMVLSNEPGYYKTGAYGIRFENLLLVTEAVLPAGGEQAMLGFEILTLAPLDRNLLRLDMLAPADIAWIDAYHARVRTELADRLEGDARNWLIAQTANLTA